MGAAAVMNGPLMLSDYDFTSVCHMLCPQEAQGNTGSWTAKLATYTPGNAARDFYRNNQLPVET